jgi:uncharacterized protein
MNKPYKLPIEQFQDVYPKMYPFYTPVLEKLRNNDNKMLTKNITIIVTEDCPLRCSYCYQHAKNSFHIMSKETAKKIVDLLFEEESKNNLYLNVDNAQAIILDFIGGEPLLEIKLIDYFMRYFKWKAIQLNHRWAINYMISISTNGILYDKEEVQQFLYKNKDKVSLSITIDGDKNLHDSCRLFKDGSPSYDIVAKNMKKHIKLYGRTVTKLTLAPANIQYTFGAIKNLYTDFNLYGVHANCIYEEGWNISHGKIFYNQLKLLSDWFLDNNIEQDFYCSLFDETIGHNMDKNENQNWCGGTGQMLSFTSNGKIQPCLRYTEFNLNQKQAEIDIGSLDTGICNTLDEKSIVKFLDSITRKSQSTEECFNCPIASGCSWCSAYNYEIYGTPNKRATFICPMHKARVLANVYYWNKIYKKYNINKNFKMNCPKEWALEIISKEEYEMLYNLTK